MIGSTSSSQYECGGSDRYCPVGSPYPRPVSPGFYTTGGNSELSRTTQVLCEPGYYCVDGNRFACIPGHYGSEYGSSIETCSGKCDAGYFCPAGSTSPTAYECGSSLFYCPKGSAKRYKVKKFHYTTGNVSNIDLVNCISDIFLEVERLNYFIIFALNDFFIRWIDLNDTYRAKIMSSWIKL